MTNTYSYKFKFPDEKIVEAYHATQNMTQICEYLGLSKTNTRARVYMRGVLESHGLPKKSVNPSHGAVRPIIPNEEFFSYGSKATSSELRKRVLKHKLMDFVCEECGLRDEWNGKQIVLHMDHIDGDSKNNVLENLRFLCPNCHSQTDTYTGKNASKAKIERCVGCGKRYRGICETCWEPPEGPISFEELDESCKSIGKALTSKKFNKSLNWVRTRMSNPAKYDPDDLDTVISDKP